MGLKFAIASLIKTPGHGQNTPKLIPKDTLSVDELLATGNTADWRAVP